MNISLLGKLIWNLLHDKDKLWVSVLPHKYLKNGNILNAKRSNGALYVWRSIVKAVGCLKERFQFEIHNGETSLWQQDYIGLGSLWEEVFYVHISDVNKQVKDLWVDGRWCLDGLVNMLPMEVKYHILSSFLSEF